MMNQHEPNEQKAVCGHASFANSFTRHAWICKFSIIPLQEALRELRAAQVQPAGMKDAVAFTCLHTPAVQPRNSRWVRRAPMFDSGASLASLPGARRLDRPQRCFLSVRAATYAGRPKPKSTVTTTAAATTTVTSVSNSSADQNGDRFVEGEKRLRRLLGTGKWRDVNRVLQSLREEGYHVNLRAYRACMEVMAENERGNEALGYLQEMKVGRDDAVCICVCFFLGCLVLWAFGTLFFLSLM